ncbi:MAG TPA: alpha/beta fold hydrolase [Candidatus Acidoferrum sp.]|nr:alpha/beta fold hydrolase [Candidatus Acidoferrum sp.]
MRVRRFEAPSYGRFGNLRHLPWREISGLALLLAAASCPAETNSLSVVQDTLGHLDAKLTRQANELLWFQRLADIAVVDKVRFTGPPPRSTNNVAPASGSNHVVISAFTFLPRQRSRDRSRPLIVLAHGEIHGNVATDEDFHVVRELVQQGYAVIAPDYRGSSGYGADFWHQIDYGGLEIEDVHAARQFMLDRYRQIDPRRVGIIGWSHGGAIALLTVFAHPGDYAACYAGAPVSDLEERIRIRGETYGQLLAAPYHLGKTVAEAPDEYRRRSPAWNVEKLRTPLLLHANTNDEDVTIGEVERLIRALQAAQKGFDWRIYTNAPGGHYFNRLDTSLALESRAEIWRFLAKHLRPPHPAANRIGCLPTTGRNTVLDFGDSPQQCRGRV